MSLLTALLAFVPALVAAKPEKAEDETARQLIALKIDLAEARLAARDRDEWVARCNEMRLSAISRAAAFTALADDNIRLRHENDMLHALYTGQQAAPAQRAQIMQAQALQNQLALQQNYSQLSGYAQQPLGAYSQHNQQFLNQQALQPWGHCTCVPGRADMFRMDRDGA